jgi:omega-amidase
MARDLSCEFLVFPGAFNMTTGPLHWELLLRARAVDHQLFVAGVAPARDPLSSYQSWAHSTVVDPWGKVLAAAAAEETVITADIDMSLVADVRRKIPIRTQRRPDVYAST